MERIEAPMIHTVPDEVLARIEDEAIENLNADAWILAKDEYLRRKLADIAVNW